MVFKDIVQVVGLNSYHTKVKLMSQSPNKKNIKVLRHPDHRVLPGTESSFMFSHHEKTVVIDQKIAFIGGIDLCWGRWDTDEHRSSLQFNTLSSIKIVFVFLLLRMNRLIDLGDENITRLKTAEELAAEEEEEEEAKEDSAKKTTEKMADNAQNTLTVK